MRKTAMFTTILFSIALLLKGCSESGKQNITDDERTGNQVTEGQDNSYGHDELTNEKDEKGELENEVNSKESEAVDHNDKVSKENNDSNRDHNVLSNSSKNEDNNTLSQYSVEEIEYARVWLQLGANQEIDELNVESISKGTPLNPNDETSMNYPVDVLQLSGTRLVDGVITYRGNGDGTINVYNVPKRWDGMNPAGEGVYKKIIENSERISIHPSDDDKVKELIKILKINS